jgi:hypothetical protein
MRLFRQLLMSGAFPFDLLLEKAPAAPNRHRAANIEMPPRRGKAQAPAWFCQSLSWAPPIGAVPPNLAVK